MKAVYLSTGRGTGSWNMAVDRLLMEESGGGRWDLTLRTYGWDPACVSLGKLQNVRREIDAERLVSDGYGLVRRPTGGRAVWHETELTYSITAPLSHPLVRGTVTEAVRKTSIPLLRALGMLGIEASATAAERYRMGGPRTAANPCFTSHGAWEIGAADGRKLVGSAQARSGGAFLEHGSILFGNDQMRILDYLPAQVPAAAREILAGHLGEGIANVREYLPDLEVCEMERALRDAFSEELGTELVQIEVGDLDGERLRQLELEYGNVL